MSASLLTLLDDIASVLDDVAVLTKISAKKTAGVLGDDLALNAQQVTDVRADRELPVVWAVAKGSMVNKTILVPLALLISAFIPWAVTPLLMLGGAFLCFEGAEKIAHKFFHSEQNSPEISETENLQNSATLEKEKIKGAVRTDFILSAEIIAITLGTVANSDFITQLSVLIGISIIMTVGVYGLVAGIVKLDDAGVHLSQNKSDFFQNIGRGILLFAPWLMRALSIAGTAAMFLVGGGILIHGIAPIHHLVEDFMLQMGNFAWLAEMLSQAIIGIISGTLILALVHIAQKMRKK